MNTIQEQLKAALAVDPIHQAEQLHGKSWKEDEAVGWTGFALAMKHNQLKSGLLALNQDTNSWNQTYKEWEAVVLRLGFELVLCDDIAGTRDKFRIYWHRERGILLPTDSYSRGNTCNSAKICFNWRPNPGVEAWDALRSCSHHGTDAGVFVVTYDCREALCLKLDELTSAGEFVTPWVQRPFLWLLSYMDSKVEGYDHNAITEERISRLPLEVQTAITPKP